MASFFTVVQYVPDPVADERVNVGVIVFGQDKLRAQFVHNWARVQRFGGERDLSYLRDFSRDVLHEATGTLPIESVTGARAFVTEQLQRMAREWTDSIRFTEPRPSLQDPDALLNDMTKRMLRFEGRKGRKVLWRTRTPF